VIIAIFSITNITAVKEQLAKEPWTKSSPGRASTSSTRGRPGRDHHYTLNWLPAAGTLMIFAGIITARSSRWPGRGAAHLRQTYVELRPRSSP
jgi:lactate permease